MDMKFLLSVAAILLLSAGSFGQDSSRLSSEQLAVSRNFVFTAQAAYPTRGPSVQLTPGFDLRVMQDSISAYLPFYGRAFTVPMNPTGGGIRIENRISEYTVKKKKKSVEISLRPAKGDDVRQINITLFPNGFARVYVSSNSRESISYSGRIEKK